MLYFCCGDIEKTWHVGNPKPSLQSCSEVQADGHELEHIKKCFSNIPIALCSVVVWKGAFAQFIYDNLVVR
jgi:hypothetical protein